MNAYKNIGKMIKSDANASIISEELVNLHSKVLDYLGNYKQTPLISKVPNKEYFSFDSGTKKSRAVNKALFTANMQPIESVIQSISSKDFTNITAEEITSALYSMAIGFCSVIDLTKTGDQKTPGTFFEYFVCNWVSKMLGINPRKQVDVLNLDMSTSLPTDYIFDLGTNQPKIHLPVKTSTRERVIQVWAHQRVLDGVYGTGRFLGILVSLSETKVDQNSLEVVEICLPEQWQIYQMFIAQMKRIYYLDLPSKYRDLRNVFPPIPVYSFGEFFLEYQNKTLLSRD